MANYRYVLVMTAIFDAGVAGVFTTREAAEEHAKALIADSDNHHDFEVREFRQNEGVWLKWRKPSWGGKRTRTPKVHFVPWETVSSPEASPPYVEVQF